jgi:ankyrin repeat protein
VLSIVDAQGKTALQRAVAGDNVVAVKELLGAGALVQVDSGPLLHAYIISTASKCVTSQLLITEALLSAGANVLQLDELG